METQLAASPPDTPRLRRVLVLLAACLVVAVALAETYSALTPLLGGVGWLAALLVHAVLSGLALCARARRNSLRAAPALYYAPPLALVLGTLALIACGHLFGGATTRSIGAEQLAWIFLVPWVEEVVFRGVLGDAFRKFGGVLWGSWFSAITFALVHSQPTLGHVLALKIGLPLGPFLLGLCCEALYVKSGKLLPAVAFHTAANATVVLFAYGDARWLDWLGLLYS